MIAQRGCIDSTLLALCFDLDGTLVETAPDLLAAANRMLGRHQRAPLTQAQVRSMSLIQNPSGPFTSFGKLDVELEIKTFARGPMRFFSTNSA